MIALLTKELRENAKWAALVAVLLSAALAWAARNDLDTGLSLVGTTTTIISALAFPAAGLALGLLTILPDARRGRWQFVMHRPISRGRIFAAKAAAAVALYAAATLPPLLAIYAWSTVPGHVPGPVTPDLLLPRLADDVGGLVWLAAGLLVAARQARWVGSRLVPAGAALLVAGLSIEFSMTFAEYAAFTAAGIALLAIPAAAAFVAGGDPPRRAWAPRSLAALSLAAGWTIAVAVAAGVAALTAESIWPSPGTPAGKQYDVLDDGRVVVVDGVDPRGGRMTDLQGRPVVLTGLGIDDHRLVDVSLDLNDPQPQHLPWVARVADWGFHAASGHLRPLLLFNRQGTARWFYVVAHNAVEGFDAWTRRSVGSVGPAGWAPGPQPFAEQLHRFGTAVIAHRTVTPQAFVAGDRSVWLLDFDHRDARRTFTADADDAVWNAGQFAEVGDPAAAAEDAVVVTRQAVYVAADGRPPTRIPQPERLADYALVNVGRAIDGRIVLDYTPTPRTGNDAPRRVVYADGRTVRTLDLPPLPAPASPPDSWSETAVPFLALPPGLLAWSIATGEMPGTPRFEALAWAATGLIAALSAAVSVPLARRRWYAPAGVVTWAAIAFVLGLPGLLVLLSTDDADVTVPCPACGRRRPVSRDRCPHCDAAFAPPAAIGIEVFQPA